MLSIDYDKFGILEDPDAEWFWPDIEVEIAAHLLEVEKMEHFTPELI